MVDCVVPPALLLEIAARAPPIWNQVGLGFALNEKDKVMTSFTGAEYFGGYLYFIKDDDYDYVYRVKLAGVTVYDASAYSYERIGIVTASDQAKMDKEAEDGESSDK